MNSSSIPYASRWTWLTGVFVLALGTGWWLLRADSMSAEAVPLVGPLDAGPHSQSNSDLGALAGVAPAGGTRTPTTGPTTGAGPTGDAPDPDPDGPAEPPLIGLEGRVTASPAGGPFDPNDLRQISARVTLGDATLLLPIPVRNGMIRLEFLRQASGRWALPNGSRPLPLEFEGGTIELMAPTLKKSVGALRFVNRGADEPSLTTRRTIDFGEQGVTVRPSPVGSRAPHFPYPRCLA